MFLKNLEIKGFKSFADSTTLVLQPGVSVVVGPNGSGKSNVVDAIGWVLGAQAPSSVRSQKMDDVIFAGTSKRPALGRAEVSLTIDNSSGMLPIDFTEVTLSRLLFRSGDSEYAINGVPCRLLDIQELLSDSGVGRHQHVIVSQGNIDAVLNARPEDRRLIIEEAAGVLKFRRRKERAERRLSSTEANLIRVQDLLREVRRQLRPLERQADAARRHGALVGELRALDLHLAGRELARLRGNLEESSRLQSDLRDQSQRVKAELGNADARLVASETELAALGETEVGELHSRYETLRERSRGLLALLAEQRRGLGREIEAAVDAALVASLEAERAQLRIEQDQLNQSVTQAADADHDIQVSETELARRWLSFEEEWGEGVPASTGEASAQRSEKSALESAITRGEDDREELLRRKEAIRQRLDRLAAALAVAESGKAEQSAAVPELRASADQHASDSVAAEVSLSAAAENARAAGAEHSGWQARVEALTLALDEARHRAGADRLADVDGVLGTLADLLQIDAGWEDAFEAAAGEALGAVVVSGSKNALQALSELAAGNHSGAIIALESVRSGMSSAGTADAGTSGDRTNREHLRSHVRPSAGNSATTREIDSLLDALLVDTVVVGGGWSEAVGVAVDSPTMNVVTKDGHRFGLRGWRLRASGIGATGAALEEARTQGTRSAETAADAQSVLDAAGKERDRLRESETAARQAAEEAEAALERHSEAQGRLSSETSEAVEEQRSLDELIARIDSRLAEETIRLMQIAESLPLAEAAEQELTQRARRMSEARRELEAVSGDVQTRRTDADLRNASVSERSRFVRDRLGHLDAKLEGLSQEADAAEGKREILEARLAAVDHLQDFLKQRCAAIERHHAEVSRQRHEQSEAARGISDRLAGLRGQRNDLSEKLEMLREKLQRAEIENAEIGVRLESATELVRNELDCEPEEALAAPEPETPAGSTSAGRARDLRAELKRMGQINPLALVEFEELSERQEFLTSQLDDIKSSRRELSKVIRAVDAEIIAIFSSAFADVSENFAQLFETLFPGGRGRLRLTNPDDLLNTGIEVEAKPSGKNVRKLSLLSGGERSLTALAYLFAVFRSRPSPFYVMDEVEAALDDVNLHRFLDLVGEFRTTAQLLIVSHQKRTMEAADVLFGVSMDPGGSSKVVSEQADEVVDLRTGAWS